MGILLFGFTFFPTPVSFCLSFIFIIPIIHFIHQSKTIWECYRKIFPILLAGYLANNFTTVYIPMSLMDKLMLVFAFNLFYTILYLIPITAYFFLSRKLTSSSRIWLLPLFWVMFEYYVNQSEVGIAILSLHNTLNCFPFFTNGLTVIGTVGYSFLVLVFNILIYKIFSSKTAERKKWTIRFVCTFAGFILLNGFAQHVYSNTDKNVQATVSIIQPNFNNNASLKGGEAKERINKLILLSSQTTPSSNLILWPESGIQGFIINIDSLQSDQVISYIQKQVVTLGKPILTGAILYRFYATRAVATSTARPTAPGNDSTNLYDVFNTAILITPDSSSPQVYIKNKLVPFIERMPYINYFPFADKVKLSVGDAYPSYQIMENNLSLQYGDLKIQPLICSEGAYFNYAAAHIKDANIIVSVSNEGWTGKAIVPVILNNLMFPLSAGLKKPVVKCSNNGISFIRDQDGLTITKSTFNKQQIIESTVQLNPTITFYSRFYQTINLSINLLFIMLTAWGELGWSTKKIRQD